MHNLKYIFVNHFLKNHSKVVRIGQPLRLGVQFFSPARLKDSENIFKKRITKKKIVVLLLVLVAGGFRCFFFGTGRSAPHREPENRRHPSPGGLRRTVRAALAKNGLLSLSDHYSVSVLYFLKNVAIFG
jgi:hypothetical protein